MTRIEIDLNVRDANGFTRVPLRNARGATFVVGDTVIVFEPDEDVEAPAEVMSLSKDGQFAFLDVRWDLLHDATGLLESHLMTSASIRGTVPSPSPALWPRRSDVPTLQLISGS